MTRAWLSALFFAVTLALVLWRPRGLSEAAGAGIGAFGVVACRLVSVRDVIDIVEQTANVLLFLLGMMVMTGIAERAGVFDALATRAARTARGSGHLLLFNVFILGALITAFLSLDVTIIVLTPIVYAVVDRLGIDPLPYLFACAFVANTASLFLPMSNLTNILVYDLLHLSFEHFAAVMLLPNLAALAVNIGAFFLIFRSRIPRRFPTERIGALATRAGYRAAATGLAIALVALLACGLAGIPLAIPALVVGALLTLFSCARRQSSLPELRNSVTWSLFPFIIAMFVVIRAVEHAWLARLGNIPTGTGIGTLFAVAAGTAVGANVVNNIPMAVAMIGVLRASGQHVPEHLAYATLIGTNIGPSIITVGSLATMLWLAIIRKRGVAISAASYSKVGAIVTPLMVAAATAALWIDIHLLHL
jgi:arsenical pump membrane protein